MAIVSESVGWRVTLRIEHKCELKDRLRYHALQGSIREDIIVVDTRLLGENSSVKSNRQCFSTAWISIR